MLGALLILGTLPLSLIFGILGIVLDKPKVLAIVITVLSGGVCAFILLSMFGSMLINC